MGGQRPGEPASASTGAIQPTDYVVFVLRDGSPTATRVKTGLTDLDYSEVLAGLTAADSVLLLTSVSQQES